MNRIIINLIKTIFPPLRTLPYPEVNTKAPETPFIIISKKSQTGSSSYNNIIFNPETVHPKSLASGILLNQDLKSQDVDYIRYTLHDNSFKPMTEGTDYIKRELYEWLEFREEYLTEQLLIHRDLTCEYCSKPHLEIGGKNPQDLLLNNKNPNLATVDHKTALAEGGLKYDKKNLCVSCRKCNSKKGTRSYHDFKSYMGQKKLNKSETF